MCTGAELPALYEAIAAAAADTTAAEGTAAAGTAAAGVGAGAAAAGGAGAALTAEEMAALEAAQQGGSLEGGLLGGSSAGAPVTEASINSIPVEDKGVQAGILDKARYMGNGLLSGGGGGGSASKIAMGMQGLQMMMPQQAPQGGGRAPPMQGQQGPLPSMYGGQPYQAKPIAGNVGTYGTAAGNSMGFTEEQKRKLRELGYDV